MPSNFTGDFVRDGDTTAISLTGLDIGQQDTTFFVMVTENAGMKCLNVYSNSINSPGIQGMFTPVNTAIVTGDNLKVAFEKAQWQIDAKADKSVDLDQLTNKNITGLLLKKQNATTQGGELNFEKPDITDKIFLDVLKSGADYIVRLLDNTNTIIFNLTQGRIQNVADPVLDQDVATKKYVDDKGGTAWVTPSLQNSYSNWQDTTRYRRINANTVLLEIALDTSASTSSGDNFPAFTLNAGFCVAVAKIIYETSSDGKVARIDIETNGNVEVHGGNIGVVSTQIVFTTD